MSTQPSVPPGWVYWVPACVAGVRWAQLIDLCQVTDNSVWSSIDAYQQCVLWFVYVYSTGESSIESNCEADSNDATEHPHDDKPRPYQCTACDKRFPSQKYLTKHAILHSSRYQCSECGKCFRSKQHLTVHSRSHSGERQLECTVCGKQFRQLSHLIKHRRTHSAEKPFECYLCEKAFNQIEALHCHLRVHTGDKPYKCLQCDKAFNQSGHLQKHKRHVHSNWMLVVCEGL